MMEDLDRIWSELEQNMAQDQGYLRLRVRPSSHCGLFLAVEKPTNKRALLLEVAAAVIPPRTEYPESSGFKVTPVPITHGPSGEVRIVLAISNNKYIDIFSVLVGDILDHVAIQPDQPSSVREFISRLIRWQEFLRRHAPEGLGDLAQQGLYGELWFLQNFITPTIGVTEAVRAWVGPLRANQDFQLRGCAVEVKTTSAEAHQVIHITNVRQLDDTGVECLLLFHISFDIRLGGVQSLPELVHEIRTSLENQDPNALYLFNERLVDAGYLEIHESRYQELKYAVRNSHFFRVRQGFPRILESELLPGIGDVQYSIAVASCMPFKVDEVAAARYMAGECNV